MQLAHWLLICLIPLAYVVGSVPFGLIVGLSRGIDPRKNGSGNIGATNVGRLLGGKFFAVVFILDLLKGLIPMVLASMIVYWMRRQAEPRAIQGFAGPGTYFLWLLTGFAAIAGHMFSLFIGFKGGKGVATSAGMVLGLFPYYTYPGIVALALWFVMFRLSRYVSLASILASAFFPLLYLLFAWLLKWPAFGDQWPLLAFAFLIAGMIVYKHRQNIRRLMAGTEQGFGRQSKSRPHPLNADPRTNG